MAKESLSNKDALRLGIAGLGVVGAGAAKILNTHAVSLSGKAGRPIEIRAVSARNRSKDRGVDLSNAQWEDDPVALARRGDVDVFVELMGGADGPAKASVEAALSRGAHVVTANKAMMAVHGNALAALAESAGAELRFEAGIAGGVPIVKALSEGLAANEMQRVYGVLNGTCNYMLTEMARTGRDFADILTDAQNLGYAEADPTADVGGWDAAHKLSLLASLAFGGQVDFDGVSVEGVERIAPTDIRFAEELGYRVKLVGVAEMREGRLAQRVAPVLMPAKSAIGLLDGVTNAVVCEGDFIGQTVFEGPGAGEGPTASAVVADILDIARAAGAPARPPLGSPIAGRPRLPRQEAAEIAGAYYLRLSLEDRPGALAEVATVLGETGVSIDQMRQHGRQPRSATVLIVTHEAPDRAVRTAVEAVGALEVSRAEPVALRIERA